MHILMCAFKKTDVLFYYWLFDYFILIIVWVPMHRTFQILAMGTQKLLSKISIVFRCLLKDLNHLFQGFGINCFEFDKNRNFLCACQKNMININSSSKKLVTNLNIIFWMVFEGPQKVHDEMLVFNWIDARKNGCEDKKNILAFRAPLNWFQILSLLRALIKIPKKRYWRFRIKCEMMWESNSLYAWAKKISNIWGPKCILKRPHVSFLRFWK